MSSSFQNNTWAEHMPDRRTHGHTETLKFRKKTWKKHGEGNITKMEIQEGTIYQRPEQHLSLTEQPMS